MRLHNRGQRRFYLTFLAILALSMLALALPAASGAAFRGANGRVAYDSNQGGTDLEIMTSLADGTGAVQRTNNTVDDKQPAWSPNGTKIAWAHFNSTTGFYEIWTMNADGTGQTALVTSGRNLTNPTWSRDGSKVAFAWPFSATDDDIYRADTSGLNVNVVPVVFTNFNERDPSYAPNSDTIAYDREDSPGHAVLWTVSDTGGSPTQILLDPAHSLTQPNWSPDGFKLAYQYQAAAGNDDIYTVNSNGSGTPTGILTSAQNERSPAWAPEGNAIVYNQVAGSDPEIYTASETGTNPTVLESRAATTDEFPDWQPVVAAQVRAKGATPTLISLVPEFAPCINGNTTHAPPFSQPTCAPPRTIATRLTVGDPIVNGKAPNFVGTVKFTTLANDGQISVSLTDLRCAYNFGPCTGGPLSDFTGLLRLSYTARVIDRAATGGVAGTITDFPFGYTFSCAATADPNVGSTCSATTTLNAIMPGAVVSTKRASWEYRDLEIIDNNNGQPFASPGSFFP